MSEYILSIDQGTSSTRVILFNRESEAVATTQSEFTQHYPQNGWVEHDPEEIWDLTIALVKEVVSKARISPGKIQGIGIANQRETTILWDRKTGIPVYPAIVWMDRRTAELCRKLHEEGKEEIVRTKTGLLLDPYFSATKLSWILDTIDGVRTRAERGDLAFGTIDSFLLWRLTRGRVHATDITNASRTLLFNIFSERWDEELCELFRIPSNLLPEVRPNVYDFGETSGELFGSSIPIFGMAGDQQAALIGQACFSPGTAKCTYGTGSFLVLNTGEKPVLSSHRLLTTVAYNIEGRTCYALEGSTFVAGAALKWLRDNLHLIKSAGESELLAKQAKQQTDLYFVPAFSGLGAPYWDPATRAAFLGITFETGIPELVAAALMSVVFQTRDIREAMNNDGATPLTTLRVDGGMAVNNWFLQSLANILGIPIERPKVTETTALGAAYLAGLKCGFFASAQSISERWTSSRTFTPQLAEQEHTTLYEGWQQAVQQVRGFRPGKL